MSFLEFVKTGTLRKYLRIHILHRSAFSFRVFAPQRFESNQEKEGSLRREGDLKERERNLKGSLSALPGMVNFDQLSGQEEMFQVNLKRRRRMRRRRRRSRPCVPN